MDPIVISASRLEREGLNLEGVAIDSLGQVVFYPDADLHDFKAALRTKSIQADAKQVFKDLGPDVPAGPSKSDLLKLRRRYLDPALKEVGASEAVAKGLIDLGDAEARAELQQRAALGIAAMRRTAVVRHGDSLLVLSTLNPSFPVILAQAAPQGQVQALTADTLVTAVEVIFEVLTGLLGILGIPLVSKVPAGRIIGRIAEIIRRNRRLRRLVFRILKGGLRGGVSAYDLLTLLVELFIYGFTWDCVKESLDEMVDLTFWGILKLIVKLQARLTPGVGQALLLADLGLIVGEISIKIYRLLNR